MTVPKKIFIWGAFSDIGTWHAEKQNEVQIEYTLSTEVDELAKACKEIFEYYDGDDDDPPDWFERFLEAFKQYHKEK